jgi:hypothetical protein
MLLLVMAANRLLAQKRRRHPQVFGFTKKFDIWWRWHVRPDVMNRWRRGVR